MLEWSLLLLSLPTGNAAARMRAWRALKACGAAVLRDGAYLLPATEACVARLREIADDVRASDGAANLLRVAGNDGDDFTALFDRTDDYAAILSEVSAARDALQASNVFEASKTAHRLRRNHSTIAAIDYFPGEAGKQALAALDDLDDAVRRLRSPDEPEPVDAVIRRLDRADYTNRRWATRARPWVDRLASAWLIRRHIDPQARFLWLDAPSDCPRDAVGFDFDGAQFTHVGARVTFEVLLASFGLEQPALKRVGEIVHFLDVGGVPPAEAAGVEQVLAGMRAIIGDDDILLQAAAGVFEGLRAAYEQEARIE